MPDDQADAIKGLVDDAGGGAYINTHTKAELEQVLAAIQNHVDDPVANPVAGVIGTAQAISTPGDVFVAPTASAGGGGGGGGDGGGGGGGGSTGTDTPDTKSTSASAAGTAIDATEAIGAGTPPGGTAKATSSAAT